jgi:hypothetical protein
MLGDQTQCSKILPAQPAVLGEALRSSCEVEGFGVEPRERFLVVAAQVGPPAQLGDQGGVGLAVRGSQPDVGGALGPSAFR